MASIMRDLCAGSRIPIRTGGRRRCQGSRQNCRLRIMVTRARIKAGSRFALMYQESVKIAPEPLCILTDGSQRPGLVLRLTPTAVQLTIPSCNNSPPPLAGGGRGGVGATFRNVGNFTLPPATSRQGRGSLNLTAVRLAPADDSDLLAMDGALVGEDAGVEHDLAHLVGRVVQFTMPLLE